VERDKALDKIKVKVFTARAGGPYQWGRDLMAELPRWGIEASHVASYAGYVASLMKTDADLIHTTIPIPFKLWRRPILLTVQGDYPREHNFLQKYYPAMVAKADAVTTSSQYVKDRIPLPATTTVIPNPIFPERFKPTEHGTRERLNLATVMNLYFKDKVRGLVDLFNALEKSGLTNFRLIVVGDGPYKHAIEAHALRTGLDIIFCGRLEDVGLVLSNSDIFVYYTHQDSFPNTITEAMASELPVVINNFGSIGEIVEHGHDGLVADNPEQFAEALRSLFVSAKYRRELGKNARASVERKFNWRTVVEQFLQIYSRLLGKEEIWTRAM
jgi:glycosyltransferase involved in cell wall biosynthesis